METGTFGTTDGIVTDLLTGMAIGLVFVATLALGIELYVTAGDPVDLPTIAIASLNAATVGLLVIHRRAE